MFTLLLELCSILSIEADLAAKINYKSLLEDFCKAKSRQTLLLQKNKTLKLHNKTLFQIDMLFNTLPLCIYIFSLS